MNIHITEFLNRGCNFIFFSVCFFNHNMKLEPYGIQFYFSRIEDSIRELTCFYAFVTVESIAAEVRVSCEGPGVSWLSRTAKHLKTGSGAMWKWNKSSGWRTDPHMFAPGWSVSCVFFENILCIFQVVWNFPFCIFYLKSKDKQEKWHFLWQDQFEVLSRSSH